MQKATSWSFVVLFTILSSILAVNPVSAQSCPGGKTAFIWVNGVWVPSQVEWNNRVITLRAKFLDANRTVEPTCVIFDAVWNNSELGGTIDLTQALLQWLIQKMDAIYYLTHYPFVTNSNDPDFKKITSQVNTRRSQGYRVVLVGHSQGTFYTNEVFQFLTTNPPDVRKLSVVNIASAAGYVNGGPEKYITQCDDIILVTPGSLPANSNFPNNVYPQTCGTYIPNGSRHFLEDSYVTGSVTKAQIYSDLVASLPDPGCGANTNCYLKDPFSGSLVNFAKVTYGPQDTNPVVVSSGGVLRLSNQIYASGNWVPLTLQTKRYFVGDFTTSLEYNSYGTGINDIQLVNAKNGVVEAHWALGAIPQHSNWFPLVFTKTNTKITGYINGALQSSVATTSDSGYYLRFDLQGNNTLQIRNLTVVAGATPPPLPPNPTGTVSASVSGYTGSSYISCALNGSNVSVATVGPTLFGNKSPGIYTLSCTPPSGYTVTVSPTSQTLVAGGTAPFAVTVKAIPAVTTGTIVITIVNPHPTETTTCSINGGPIVNISDSKTFTNQSPGDKTVECTPPIGYTITSYSPAKTQNLAANQTRTFTVTQKAPPPPVLSSIVIPPPPKVNTNINVIITGTGFVSDMEAYFCTSTSTTSCTAARISSFSVTQVKIKNIIPTTLGTLYIRLKTATGAWSNTISMFVIP